MVLTTSLYHIISKHKDEPDRSSPIRSNVYTRVYYFSVNTSEPNQSFEIFATVPSSFIAMRVS